MSWSNDLKKLTTKGGHDLGELMQAVKIEIFSGIVEDTRVKTGRLKGNWQIQENSPASGERDVLDTTPNGDLLNSTQTEIEAGSSIDGVTYFTNNLPYAQVYEEKDAMVARNITRAKANIKRMAKKIKG